MEAIEIGKTYRVTHTRKGEFVMKVTADTGDFVEGIVVDSEIKGLTQD